MIILFLNTSVQEIKKSIPNSSQPLFVIVATHLPTSNRWKPKFWLSVPGGLALKPIELNKTGSWT